MADITRRASWALVQRLANTLAFERRCIRSSFVALVRRTLPVRLHYRALLARRIDSLGASGYLRDATLTVLVLAAVAAGCGPRSVALYEKVMGSPSYGRVTESATRTRAVHDGLDTRFILSATWLSGPWVSAFAEEYSNIYYLDAARREQVISHWRGESEKYVRFFVALYVPEERGNDLEKPGTLWSLRLVRADEKDFEP